MGRIFRLTKKGMGKKNEILVEVGEIVVQTLMESGHKDSSELIIKLNNQLLPATVTPKMLNITYSAIKHWENKGFLLLPPNKEVDEWRKFSLLEYFWIQSLRQIIKLGCSLDKVVPKLKFAYQNHRNPNEIINYKEIPDVKEFELSTSLGFLTNVIFVLLQTGKSAIHLFEDNCQFIAEKGVNRIQALQRANETIYKPHITLCISDIVFAADKTNKRLVTNPIFNSQEIEILNLFRNDELKEITVKLENGKPISIEFTEKFHINKDDVNKRLLEYITSDYQEITAITNGGKPIHFLRKTKRKII